VYDLVHDHVGNRVDAGLGVYDVPDVDDDRIVA